MLNKNLFLLLSSTCLITFLSTQTLLSSNLNESDCPQEDSFGQKNSFKREEFFKQKYSFSTPVLDVLKLSRSLLLAKDEQERLPCVLIFEEESNKGNAEAQERLYSYYSNPLFKKLNLINPAKANNLLNLGKDQNKGWAYWESAEKNKRSPTDVMTEHYIASNLSYLKAYEYLEKNDSDNWSLIIKRLVPESNKNKKISFSKVVQQDFKNFIYKYETKQYALPLVYLHKEMTKSSYSITYNLLYWSLVKSAADLGNIESMMMYGGEMQKQNNIPIAFKYCKKAADLGDSNALSNAGLLLKRGFEGQEPDKESAFKLFRQSADLGNPIAMSNVALLLINGFNGQKPNPRLALSYFYEAAKSGDAEDLFNLALLLEQGFDGQKPDKGLAFKYYFKSADLGNVNAMLNAALLLQEGFEGQKPNKALALEYSLRAANLGNLKAMFNVACLYYQGFEGQKSDLTLALEYFLEAADLG